MSRCSEYTHWFIAMNKKEQAAFTRAFVEVIANRDLSQSERKTLTSFANVWFDGGDFNAKGKFDILGWFLKVCRRRGIKVTFLKRPSKGGKATLVEWDGHEGDGGSHWPHKTEDQSRDDLIEQKRKYRNKVKRDHLAKLEIDEPDFRPREESDQVKREEVEAMIDAKFGAPVVMPEPISVEIARHVPASFTRRVATRRRQAVPRWQRSLERIRAASQPFPMGVAA